MSRFDSLSEFDKEKKKLAKKYRSIPADLKAFEQILLVAPTGIGPVAHPASWPTDTGRGAR